MTWMILHIPGVLQVKNKYTGKSVYHIVGNMRKFHSLKVSWHLPVKQKQEEERKHLFQPSPTLTEIPRVEELREKERERDWECVYMLKSPAHWSKAQYFCKQFLVTSN